MSGTSVQYRFAAANGHAGPDQGADSREAHRVPRTRDAARPIPAGPSALGPNGTIGAAPAAGPAKTIPTQTVPTQTVPSHAVPAHTVPIHTAPTHTIPAHTVPSQTTPAQSAHAPLRQQPPVRPISLSGVVALRVHSRDPISELGILAQLRQRPDVRIVAEGEEAAVVLAIADSVDEVVTRWLRTLHRAAGAPVVLVIGRLDPRAVTDVVCSGVRGVLHRSEATPERLVRAVRAAARGNGELPPDLLRHLLDQVNRLNQELLEPSGRHFSGLTDRERDVLRLVAEGYSTREVAAKLSYSERTIKAVLQSLTCRLQMRNRTQAVAYAVRNGWI